MVWSFLSQQRCFDKPSQTRCRCLWCDCLPQSNPLNIDTIDAGCLVSTLHVCVRSWVCMIFGTKTVALKREVSVLYRFPEEEVRLICLEPAKQLSKTERCPSPYCSCLTVRGWPKLLSSIERCPSRRDVRREGFP